MKSGFSTLPRGAIISMKVGNACPAGYVIAFDPLTLNSRLLRNAATVGSGLQSPTHAHATDGHTHTIAGHTHTITQAEPSQPWPAINQFPGGDTDFALGPHIHTPAGLTTVDIALDPRSAQTSTSVEVLPPYNNTIYCRKVV